MRLEYLPLRICKEWRPAAISASTVAPWSIDPTDVPSTEMSNLPRRSSIPKAARVTLSVADTSHLLSPAAPYGRSAGSPVAPVGPWPPKRRRIVLSLERGGSQASAPFSLIGGRSTGRPVDVRTTSRRLPNWWLPPRRHSGKSPQGPVTCAPRPGAGLLHVGY